ncbi:MAG: hypothetical protein MJ211_07485 [Bacteroidales bacterium]|nr:hypothetical protein [Bacteroidales bacterium]
MRNSRLMYDYLIDCNIQPEVKNGSLIFDYEGEVFLYLNNDEDDSYFEIDLPNLYEVNSFEINKALKIINEINSGFKLVKLIESDGHIHATAQILIDSSPELDDLVPRLVHMLIGAKNEFNKYIK